MQPGRGGAIVAERDLADLEWGFLIHRAYISSGGSGSEHTVGSIRDAQQPAETRVTGRISSLGCARPSGAAWPSPRESKGCRLKRTRWRPTTQLHAGDAALTTSSSVRAPSVPDASASRRKRQLAVMPRQLSLLAQSDRDRLLSLRRAAAGRLGPARAASYRASAGWSRRSSARRDGNSRTAAPRRP